MHGNLRIILYGSFVVLITLLGHDWYRKFQQINQQRDQIAQLDKLYGQVLWRVTSACRWWAEYDAQVQLGYATNTAPENLHLGRRYQFFTQNLQDALALEGNLIEIAQKALRSVDDTLRDAKNLNNTIIASGAITPEIVEESSRIKKEVVGLTGDFRAFQSVYFDLEGTLAPMRRELMWQSMFTLALLIVLTISTIAIYRQGIVQEQKVRQSKLEAFGTLSAGYSHAISSIISGMQMMIDGMKVTPRSKKDCEIFGYLEHGIERMRLLNGNLSLIGRGQPVNDSQASLSEVIEQNISLLADPDPRTTYEIDVSDRVGHILVPQIAMSTIIAELVSNARKHSEKQVSPCIWITADIEKGPKVLIVIKDNGCGISKQNIRKVFDPFFSTTGEGHAGLGLTSVKSLVETMDGWLSIYNRMDMSGAIVKVMIPLKRGKIPAPQISKKR